MSTHFIVLITGQNISNLAPILHEYKHGDTVWLLRSEVVDPDGVAFKRFSQVLTADGGYNFICKPAKRRIGREANAVVAAIGSLLKEIFGAANCGDVVCLVANGGTKPMSHAVEQVLRERFSESEAQQQKQQKLTLSPAIYAEAEPVRLLTLESAGGSREVRWRKPSVDEPGAQCTGVAVKLQDVLACAGYAIADPGKEPLYCVSGLSCGAAPEPPAWQCKLESFVEAFGPVHAKHQVMREAMEDWLLDPGKTRLKPLAIEAAKQAAAQLQPPVLELEQWCKLEKALTTTVLDALVSERLKGAGDIRDDLLQLQQSLAQVHDWLEGALLGVGAGALDAGICDQSVRRDGLAKMLAPLCQENTPVFPAELAANVFKKAVALQEKAQIALHPKTTQNDQSLGAAFENAVAARVLKLVNGNQRIGRVVSQIWNQVGLVRVGNAKKPAGEWDVVLVLRNGILVCIECKSWNAADKTLKAQQRMVHAGGSALARMWVCSPMVTAAETQPFFQSQRRFRQTCEEIGLEHLPFTIENCHSEEYRLADGSPFSCPSFEEAFLELFKPYLEGDAVQPPCDDAAGDT